MKKVLSLVLVAVLAIGMSVGTFAAWDPSKVTAQTVALTDPAIPDEIAPEGQVYYIQLTRAMFGGTAETFTNSADYYTFTVAANGAATTGITDPNTLGGIGVINADIKAAADDVVDNALNGKSWAQLVQILNDATGTLDVVVSGAASNNGTYAVNVRAYLGATGTYATPTAGASTTNDTLADNGANGVAAITDITVSTSNKSKATCTSATELPATVASGEIVGALTSASNGINADNTDLTSSDISKAKIDFRANKRLGGQVFEGITWDKKNGRIKIEFVDVLATTKDVDYEVELYLTVDGKAQRDYILTLDGTVSNDVENTDSDYDYLYLGDGTVAEADEGARNVEIDLGNDVIIRDARLTKGKKYFGVATTKTTTADDDMMDEYPTIKEAITIKHQNLTSVGGYVDLSDYGKDYYVYDADLNYLGKSGGKLTFSTKYYLSTEELDVAGDDIEEPGEIEEPEEPEEPGEEDPGTGGDGGSPSSNPNKNPDTGANGFMSIAVVAAVVSLAAAGVVARKK